MKRGFGYSRGASKRTVSEDDAREARQHLQDRAFCHTVSCCQRFTCFVCSEPRGCCRGLVQGIMFVFTRRHEQRQYWDLYEALVSSFLCSLGEDRALDGCVRAVKPFPTTDEHLHPGDTAKTPLVLEITPLARQQQQKPFHPSTSTITLKRWRFVRAARPLF